MDDDLCCFGCKSLYRVLWSGTYARWLCPDCVDLYVIYELYPQLLEDTSSRTWARKIGVPAAQEPQEPHYGCILPFHAYDCPDSPFRKAEPPGRAGGR